MADIPNKRHSELVVELCTRLRICDPYRILNFNKKDFTYVPRCIRNENKSRIDFFLISEFLLKEVSKCDIAVSLQNSLFDHKAILLDFNNRKGKPVIRQKINNKVLQSDLLEIVVLTSTAETYIQNAVFIPNRDNLLRIIGQLKLIIHNAGLNWCERPGEAVPEEAVRAREGLLNTARYNLQILNIEVLENAALVCDDDIFMETLVNNIRNDTCSFQAFFLKEAKKKFAEGVKTLNTLKEKYSDNAEQIKNLEAVLNVIADRELRAELENFAIFEHLGSEKM
jgi:hypothetical protein